MEVWIGIASAIGSVAVVAAGVLIVYLNSGVRAMKRMDELTTKVFSLQDEALGCQKREFELKQELQSSIARIRNLETATGIFIPPSLATGTIVADLRGVIRDYSPALTTIFNYLHSEVIGRDISILIPESLRSKHQDAFDKAVRNPEAIDPLKEIITYGLSKGGQEIPIAITLHGWRAGTEGLITASIRQRVKSIDEQSTPK